MRNSIPATIIIILFGSLALNAQNDLIQKEWRTKEARQFDFWIGKWDVNLRMIQKDQTWKDSVKAKVEIYPILDGKAILELWDSPSIKGFSLRYFDPSKKKWILYLNWPSNSRSSIGSLEGSFRHGRGDFFSKRQLGQEESKTMISRYTFCDITENSLRWDDRPRTRLKPADAVAGSILKMSMHWPVAGGVRSRSRSMGHRKKLAPR